MTKATLTLRAVLVLAGLFTTFTGINIAFGGIATLGWQGVDAFFAVTNEHDFLVQDSHVRFLGGVWIGVGLLLLLSPIDLKRCRPALTFVFGLIFLGGLARLGQLNFGVTFGPDIVGSLAAEVIGMPVLYLWLRRALRDVPHHLPRAAVLSSSRAM
jgi:hypothetical protein